MSIYEFSAKKANGEEVSLSQYQGKVLLIVNVASQCGFTPQYEGLQSLYADFHHRGLEILAFPCNQFGSQEPGSDAEIEGFCTGRFGVKFPIFSKIDVNGATTHPLFAYLKKEAKGILGTKRIKWNFTKFLVDKKGKVLARFAPNVEPFALIKEIEKIL